MLPIPSIGSVAADVRRRLAPDAAASEFEWVPVNGDPPEPTTNRSYRTFGLIAAAILAVAPATLWPASAVAHTSFSATDVSVESNNGVVTELTGAPAGDVHYSGLERAPERLDLVISVKAAGGSWQPIGTKNLPASGLEGTVAYDFDTIDVLQQSSLTAADLRRPDGQTSSTDLTIRVEATLVDGGPSGTDVTSAATDTFTVAVTNVPAGANVGGRANTNGG